jgi:glycosyltransferase involved in cell wall biosynthesis
MYDCTVFIPVFNAKQYIAETLQSLAKQSNQNFEIVLVDDASSDGTVAIAKKILDGLFSQRYRLVTNKENLGKAANAFHNLRNVESEFIAVLDGDDQLIIENILDLFLLEYKNGYDVVYSNYVTSDGRKGHCSMLDPLRSPREQGWRSSHFFSFRASLFKNVPITYFQDKKGDWIRSACDLAIAFPILDQTRRYKFIDLPAYRYTSDSPSNHHNKNGMCQNLSSYDQMTNGKMIVSKTPLACRNPIEGSGVPFESLVLNRLSNLESALRPVRLERKRADTDLSLVSLAMLVLKDEIPIAWLRQTGGWTIDCLVYAYLAELLNSIEKPSILEFGSGAGSKIIHKLARNRGGQCVSVEHDKTWFDSTVRELKKNNLSTDGSVVYAELEEVSVFGIDTKFYNMSWLPGDKKFDVVIVDGPPAALAPVGRLAALPSVAKNLSDKFHVLLDDFNRTKEREIVRVWKRVAPELKYEEVQFEKAVCVISSESFP